MSDRLLNDRLDWNLLRTFRVIGQELSISRAAARLHLTQLAVSQALKRLEEQLGRQLIARRGPRFVLTDMGEQLFQLAGEVYGQMSQISGLLEQPADELVGKVRLLMISRIVSERFDEFLADFHRQHPRVDLEIDVMRSSDIVAALQEKTATAGLSLNRRPQPRLSSASSCVSAMRFSAASTMPCSARPKAICSGRISSVSPATRLVACCRR